MHPSLFFFVSLIWILWLCFRSLPLITRWGTNYCGGHGYYPLLILSGSLGLLTSAIYIHSFFALCAMIIKYVHNPYLCIFGREVSYLFYYNPSTLYIQNFDIYRVATNSVGAYSGSPVSFPPTLAHSLSFVLPSSICREQSADISRALDRIYFLLPVQSIQLLPPPSIPRPLLQSYCQNKSGTQCFCVLLLH